MAKIIPFFPNPPRDYNQQYMDEIVKAFSIYVTRINTPGDRDWETKV